MSRASRTNENHRIWIGVGLGALAFAGLALYGDLGDPGTFMERVRSYDVRWFLLGLLGATLNYGVRFFRWHVYLRRLGIDVPTRSSFRIFLAGFAMSISPGKLGEVVKSALLAEEFDVPFERSAPIVLAERLTDLVALVILVGIGSLAVPSGHHLALVAFVGVGFLLALFAVPTFGRAVLGQLGRVRFLARILPKLHTAHDALITMLSPGPLLGATLIATIAWFFECVSLWAIVRGFPGASLSLLESTFAYSAPTILGAVALLPGGLLVTEASMTGTLRFLGGAAIPESVAASTTLLVRLATLWWAVLLGLCAFVLSRRGTSVSGRTIRGTTDAPSVDAPGS